MRLVPGGGLHRIHILRGDRPAVAVAALDRLMAHPPEVHQQPLAVARGIVEHRAIERPLIFEAVAEVPVARADRHRLVVARELRVGDERDLLRRRPAGDLGQQADRIVEIGDRSLHPVVPGGIRRRAAHPRSRLLLRDEPAVHRRAKLLKLGHDDRGVIIVERIAERRDEHHHAGGAGLVLVEDDLREPFAEQHPVDRHRLRHLRHEAVAVVIVADVFLVETRERFELALRRIGVAHVPVGDQLQPVGIVVAEQDDRVVQQALRLGVLPGEHPIEHMDLALGRYRLGGVEAGVDPHHRAALGGERLRLRLVHPFRLGELARDLAIMVELREVGGGGDDRHPHRTPLGGFADVDQLHPVGPRGERLQIFLIGVVIGEIIVAARLGRECLRRRGEGARFCRDRLRRRRTRLRRRDRDQRRADQIARLHLQPLFRSRSSL